MYVEEYGEYAELYDDMPLLKRLDCAAVVGAEVKVGGRVGVAMAVALADVDAVDAIGADVLATDGADEAATAATVPRSQGFGGEPMNAGVDGGG